MNDVIIDLETKRLEKLAPRELARRLMTLPPRRRMELIFAREDAGEIVKALPEQDFYMSMKEIGPGDSLPLLALANLSQLNHVFDIEWWQKSQVSPGKALGWLSMLAQASEQKMAQWLFEVDFELLVVLYKGWMKVEMLPEDGDLTELRESLPKLTLDEQYFWEVRYPQYEDFIKSILTFLFETHQDFYRELMHHIIYSVDAMMEEDAYRFHRGRLEDQAIPDFYDALEIYWSLSAEDVVRNKELTSVTENDSVNPPTFAVAQVAGHDLLNQALQEIGDRHVVDMLQVELAALANKVVVADQLAPDDPESLRDASSKVAATVNLGLDLLGGGDPSVAKMLLMEIHLEHLFRVAHTRLARVREKAKRLAVKGWLASWPYGAHLLDDPWQDRFEALVRKTPQLVRDQREEYVRTRADLRQAVTTLNVLIALGSVYRELGGAALAEPLMTTSFWSQAQIREPKDVTLGAMIMTAAARARLDGEWRAVPLDTQSWKKVFAKLDPRSMSILVRESLADRMNDPVRQTAIEPYLETLFDVYSQELSAFDEDNPPDPRLVPFFLFRSTEDEA